MNAKLLVLYLAIAALLTSCATRLTQYRPWYTSEQSLSANAGELQSINETDRWFIALRSRLAVEGQPDNNPYRGTNFHFSIIEFDDQGEMWNRNQLENTLQAIRQYKVEGHPVTLLTFVHGWKHDASDYSSNLLSFRKFVCDFAQFVAATNADSLTVTGAHARVVVGVYIAWRGNTRQYNNLFLNDLASPIRQTSFYDRKNTAARVAGVSATEAILSLSTMTRINFHTDNTPDESKVVIIGHSFGGLIVERAVAQAMLGGMLINAVNVANGQDEKKFHLDEAARYDREADAARAKVSSIDEKLKGRSRDKYADDAIEDSSDAVGAAKSAEEKVRMKEEELAGPEKESEKVMQSASAIWLELTKLGYSFGDYIILEGALSEFAQALGFKSEQIAEKQSDIAKLSLNRPLKTFKDHREILMQVIGRLDALIYFYLNNSRSTNESSYKSAWAKVTTAQRILAALTNDQKIVNYSDRLKVVPNLTSLIDEASDLARKRDEAESRRQADRTIKSIDWDTLMANRKAANEKEEESREHARQELYRARNPRFQAGRPPADLILLANPASEALVARMLSQSLTNQLIRDYTTLTNADRPWIVSVSSKGDDATAWWFPFGRLFSAVFQDFRSYPQSKNSKSATQRQYYSHTAPQFPPMVSHRIQFRHTNDLGVDLETIISTNLSKKSEEYAIYTSRGEYTLVNNTNSECENRSSYWVIEAPKELIPDHGAVFTPEFFGITAAFYRISQRKITTPPPDPFFQQEKYEPKVANKAENLTFTSVPKWNWMRKGK